MSVIGVSLVGQCSVAPVNVQLSIRTAGTTTPPKSPRSVRRSLLTALVAGQRLEIALGEAEVPDRPDDPAVLDEERPVAGHPGHDRELRVDRVRVVEAGHEQAALQAARRARRAASSPAVIAMFSGNGPYGFGAGRPWPVDARPARAAVWAS